MNYFLYLLLILCGILAVQLIFSIWNRSKLPLLGGKGDNKSDSVDEKVRVSVLIPARNEQIHIRDCVESVLGADTKEIQLEVIVLNDRSEDKTGEILEELAVHDRRLRILQGRDLPSGWMGKSYACHQLAQQATGEWWLYMDADVRLEKEALSAVLTTAIAQEKGLVTGFPRQITETWLEKLVVPMMKFTIISHLPIVCVRGSQNARFVAATGAFMFIHRDTYAATGGHEAIKADLLDDMQLARAVKRAGHPVTLADVHFHTRTRMYQNAAEVWNGYKKNMYEGLGRSGLLLTCILVMYAILYLLPPISFLFGLFSGEGQLMAWGALGTLLGMLVKRVADRTGGHPLWLSLLQPASIACVIAIGISSWLGAVTGKGYVWKGRRYN
ncbi:glycosyltransferase [Paenibacillus sp. Marseille-Q4541]|uniref:glycosyltransferase n=1 Tax=Paenibacillus sp. Marseille-Q4541 TaxID=2831522 RepID=UPI001BA762F5|nr:glycosyltransferase [Paenibacillus sp. Marseille-Q4541]